ncbi:kinase-like domain-containing protein [Absidia repens]|uniref:non-specific serine/threonine protein kinase n=1 Tax=Absidia repens TaxID=90262 RepID=A0A1X2I3E7_9FUNG|nr:kinase-like domain-containing protein [Absidia repens]
MDYCAMGDLSQYIKQIRKNDTTCGPLGGLPENTLRHFLYQLASALRFLRSQNLVHRDIKPQNLLLVSPPTIGSQSSSSSSDLPILQVADFGFARFLPNASMADTLCGSPLYMGPEILSYKKYDARADLWSVGAVLYEMMTGRPPFRAQNHLELLKKIQHNNDVIRFPQGKMTDDGRPPMGDDLKDLIRKLLKKDPVERISFEEFFAHPAISSSRKKKYPLLAYTTSATGRHSADYSPHSASTTATTATTSPITKHQYNPPASYEPPPFAQPSTSYQDSHRMIPGSSSPTNRPQSRFHIDTNNDDVPPQGRPGRAVEFNDLHATRSTANGTTQPGEVEDVLHEYVVLDRRIIVTNQFADEMNDSPHNDIGERRSDRRQSIVGQVAIPRRKSSSASSASSSSNQTGYPPSSASPNTPPFTASREKRISVGKPGFAFTKALTIASERLFGTGHSPPNYNKLQQTMVGSPRGFLMMGAGHSNSGGSARGDDSDEEDERTMLMIEKTACMGHAVAKFADSKFDLLMNGRGGIIGVANEPTLATEALVLHLKALALLELGLDMAKKYWHRRSSSNPEQQQHHRHDRQQPLCETPSSRSPTPRLNDVVQWMRERFNECLDRASIEKSKCEHSDSSSYDSSSGNNPCVERLLYDRALEMSRAAAVHELVGENIAECEQDYQTAIWMLEAILEVCDDKDMAIEEGDRKIINKFIDSIQQRILVLRRKLVDQNEQKPSNNVYGAEER